MKKITTVVSIILCINCAFGQSFYSKLYNYQNTPEFGRELSLIERKNVSEPSEPCIANAGLDWASCGIGTGKEYLGAYEVVNGGQAPYKYHWHTDHDSFRSRYYLEDVNVAKECYKNKFTICTDSFSP